MKKRGVYDQVLIWLHTAGNAWDLQIGTAPADSAMVFSFDRALQKVIIYETCHFILTPYADEMTNTMKGGEVTDRI